MNGPAAANADLDHDTISEVFAVVDGVVHATGRSASSLRAPSATRHYRAPEAHAPPMSGPIRIGVAQAYAPQVPAAIPLRRCAPAHDPRLIMLLEPNGERAAAFRLLRDNLASTGMPRVLAVSSPQAKGGATTCAINLALASAEHGRQRVLLVDANLAAPALAGILGIDDGAPANGPTSYRTWSGPFTVSALIPTLHVATVARRPDGSPTRIDFTALMRMIDTSLRIGYDQIILDIPVIDGSPETRLFRQLASGVLFAVRSGATTKRALLRAAEEVGPQRALGVMLMDALED